MSIINQMLRDLEHRNPEKTELTLQQTGIRIISKPAERKLFWLGGLLALFLSMAGYWFYYQHTASLAPVAASIPVASLVTNSPLQPVMPIALSGQERHVESDSKDKQEHLFFKLLMARFHAKTNDLHLPKITPVSKHRVIRSVAKPATATTQIISVASNSESPLDNSAELNHLSEQQQAELLYQQATQGNPDLATAKLRELLALNPRHLKARLLLAKTLNQRGLVPEAAAFLDESLHLFPAHVQLLTLRAQLFLQQKNPAAALKTLQRLDLKKHTTETSLSLLASSYQQLGAYAQAAEGYQHLVQLNPAKAQHWLGLALMQEQLGNTSLARDAYNQALAKHTLKTAVVDYIQQRLLDLR